MFPLPSSGHECDWLPPPSMANEALTCGSANSLKRDFACLTLFAICFGKKCIYKFNFIPVYKLHGHLYVCYI